MLRSQNHNSTIPTSYNAKTLLWLTNAKIGLSFLSTLDPIIDGQEEKRLVENLNDKELKQLNILLEKIRD